MDIVLALVFLFSAICAFVGLTVIIRAIWRASIWGQRHIDEKRNARPDTLVDTLTREIIARLQSDIERTKWATGVDANNTEFIFRDDRQVTIKQYYNPDYIVVDVENTGEFRSSSIKPELATALSKTCLAFKQYVAVKAVFEEKR